MILELNSYLKYEIDDDAEIVVKVSNLYDAIQDAESRLWQAYQDELGSHTSPNEPDHILDSIILKCAIDSGNAAILTPLHTDEDTDTDADTGDNEENNLSLNNEKGVTWLEPK